MARKEVKSFVTHSMLEAENQIGWKVLMAVRIQTRLLIRPSSPTPAFLTSEVKEMANQEHVCKSLTLS